MSVERHASLWEAVAEQLGTSLKLVVPTMGWPLSSVFQIPKTPKKRRGSKPRWPNSELAEMV